MKLSSLYKEIAEKHQIKESLVKKISDHYFYSIATTIREGRGAEFLIHNFGTFKFHYPVLRGVILRVIRSYKNGITPREEAVEKVSALLQVRKILFNNRS